MLRILSLKNTVYPTRERKLIEELDMLRYEQKRREGDEIQSLFTSSGGFNMAQVKHFVQKKWGSSLPSSSLDRISNFIETVEEGRKRKRLLCMTGGDIERLFERVLSRACTPERLWQPKPEPKYGIRSLEGICMLPSITRTVDINSLSHCCLELDRRLLISNTAWSRENEWLRKVAQQNNHHVTRDCTIPECKSPLHTRILDPIRLQLLETSYYHCRTVLAHIMETKDETTIGVVKTWTCQPFTISSLRQDSEIKIKLAPLSGHIKGVEEYSSIHRYRCGQIMLTIAIICSGYVMFANDLEVSHTPESRYPGYPIHNTIMSCCLLMLNARQLDSHTWNPFIRNILLEHCNLPSDYRCAGLAWAAYEVNDTNIKLNILIQDPFTSEEGIRVEKLVELFNDNKVIEKVSNFRTNATYTALELTITFADKIFNANLPLPKCNATPRQGFGTWMPTSLFHTITLVHW